jgi:hypothetical protein
MRRWRSIGPRAEMGRLRVPPTARPSLNGEVEEHPAQPQDIRNNHLLQGVVPICSVCMLAWPLSEICTPPAHTACRSFLRQWERTLRHTHQAHDIEQNPNHCRTPRHQFWELEPAQASAQRSSGERLPTVARPVEEQHTQRQWHHQRQKNPPARTLLRWAHGTRVCCASCVLYDLICKTPKRCNNLCNLRK